MFDPRLGFEHGGLHAPFDLEATVLDDVTIGAGGDGDRRGDDARGVAERAGDGEAVPARGPPRLLEGHAGADDRQPGPAGEIGCNVQGDEHTPAPPSSIEHAKVEFGSSDVNVKDGVALFVGDDGPLAIVVSGGSMSMTMNSGWYGASA